MKKVTAMTAVVFLVMTTMVYGFGGAFRCGGKLIRVGDSKAQVLRCCGQPDLIDTEGTVTNETTQKVGSEEYTTGSTTIIETWTYNCGPSQFMKILRFSGSQLISIEDGDYGW